MKFKATPLTQLQEHLRFVPDDVRSSLANDIGKIVVNSPQDVLAKIRVVQMAVLRGQISAETAEVVVETLRLEFLVAGTKSFKQTDVQQDSLETLRAIGSGPLVLDVIQEDLVDQKITRTR